jgi:hypothetical protein
MKRGNKKIKNATPSEYKGIKFRSKLEMFTYRHLMEASIPFEYEEHRFTLLEAFESSCDSYEPIYKKGRKFGFGLANPKIRAMTYKPDFVNENDNWIIEVKGFRNDAFPLRWKLFKAQCQDQGTTLYLPGTQKEVLETIDLIVERFYTEKGDTSYEN